MAAATPCPPGASATGLASLQLFHVNAVCTTNDPQALSHGSVQRTIFFIFFRRLRDYAHLLSMHHAFEMSPAITMRI